MRTEQPFDVTTQTGAAGPVLALRGRVDRDAESALMTAYTAAVEGGAERVVLDFHAATYMNSSGLAAIVALLTHARSGAVAVAARGLTSHYRHLFEITRLTDLVEVEPTAEAGDVT